MRVGMPPLYLDFTREIIPVQIGLPSFFDRGRSGLGIFDARYAAFARRVVCVCFWIDADMLQKKKPNKPGLAELRL